MNATWLEIWIFTRDARLLVLDVTGEENAMLSKYPSLIRDILLKEDSTVEFTGVGGFGVGGESLSLHFPEAME